MYNKIGVLGDGDSILAFKAIGVDAFEIYDIEKAKDTIFELSRSGYAIIFITENLAQQLGSTLKKYKTKPYPAIIPIPSTSGSSGYSMQSIRNDMEKAIGSNILFDKED